MKSIFPNVYKSDETCEKCGNPLYYIKERPDIKECLNCGKQRLEAKTKEIEYRGGELAEKYGTYDMLGKQSIIDDRTIKRATFDNFKTDEPEADLNLKKAKKLAERLLNGETLNAFLQGKQGTGKSHLSMSILKEVNENSYPYRKCLFVDFPSLMLEVSDFKNYQTLSQNGAISLLSKPDVLVIDDIGAETNSDNGQAKEYVYKTLQAIAQNRQDKSTIYTTNISSERLGTLYGSRVRSRITRGVAGNSIIFKDSTDKRKQALGF